MTSHSDMTLEEQRRHAISQFIRVYLQLQEQSVRIRHAKEAVKQCVEEETRLAEKFDYWHNELALIELVHFCNTGEYAHG